VGGKLCVQCVYVGVGVGVCERAYVCVCVCMCVWVCVGACDERCINSVGVCASSQIHLR